MGGQIFRLRQTLPERRFYSGIKSSGHGFEVRQHKENETLFVDLCHRRFTARTVLLGLIACYETKYFTCCPNLTVVVAVTSVEVMLGLEAVANAMGQR